MVHPFFDELREPGCRFPDSRHAGGASKELPRLFDFTHQGEPGVWTRVAHDPSTDSMTELSIAPEKNVKLVPAHARKELLAKGIDPDNFVPMSREDMRAQLD